MSRSRILRAGLAVAALATVAPLAPAAADHGGGHGYTTPAPRGSRGPDDAVVVAVIDSGIAPYHWDFVASQMPQALNRDRGDDLPLTRPPHTWLPGFPAPKAFASYREVKLSLSRDPDADIAPLRKKDDRAWKSVRTSGPAGVNYHWFPGTKIVGALSFDYEEQVSKTIDEAAVGAVKPVYGNGPEEHGQGSASVSVGNVFGTCPECLLVFIQSTDTVATERALAWAHAQPWIDVVSNSYGLQTFPTGHVRDGVYGGPVDTQRAASERGQTIVFSAGNGVENGFGVPMTTLTSSVKGPDWVVTVGATHPSNRNQYSGAGKPVDVSGIGDNYPSSYDARTVTGGGRFGGTSNAAPTVAGTYGRGLYLARRAMRGPSRVQRDGVVSVGAAICGARRRACEVRDGRLTAVELRHRLLKGAVTADGGTCLSSVGTPCATVPNTADERFAAEGHGTYYARLRQDDAEWLAEFDRFYLPIVGRAAEVARPAGEADWFVVDSWCRQHVFGAWRHGYYVQGRTTLPQPAATAPGRSAYQTACAALTKPPATPRP